MDPSWVLIQQLQVSVGQFLESVYQPPKHQILVLTKPAALDVE